MKKTHEDVLFAGTPPKRRIRGAGDVVAMVAQPIAKGLDKVLGTDLQNCGGCKKRQDALNKAMPLN